MSIKYINIGICTSNSNIGIIKVLYYIGI